MKRCLFFSSVGENASGAQTWLSLASQQGDVAIVSYAPGTFPSELRKNCRFFEENKDYKVPNFLHFYHKYSRECAAYDYFFFIDDDIHFLNGSLKKILAFLNDCAPDLLQPSLDIGSDIHWPHMAHDPGNTWMRVDYVESQCFVVSSRLLRQTLPYMNIFVTGYGWDIALMMEAYLRGYKGAILYTAQVHHPQRILAQSVRSGTKYPEQTKRISAWLTEHFHRPINTHVLYVMSRLRIMRMAFYRPVSIVFFTWQRLKAFVRQFYPHIRNTHVL